VATAKVHENPPVPYCCWKNSAVGFWNALKVQVKEATQVLPRLEERI